MNHFFYVAINYKFSRLHIIFVFSQNIFEIAQSAFFILAHFLAKADHIRGKDGGEFALWCGLYHGKDYSERDSPEPPISFGTSFILGSPSLTCSTDS